jgi:hypothetical protein
MTDFNSLLTAATMYHFATDVLILCSVQRGQQRALLTRRQYAAQLVIFIMATVPNNSAFSAHSDEEEREKERKIHGQKRPGVALFQTSYEPYKTYRK